MLYSSFKSTDKKEKTSCFTVHPLIDISNCPDAEIVDILSGTVDFNLVATLKIFSGSGVKRSNTNNRNITETFFI